MADVVRFAMYRERHDIISTFLMASEQQQRQEIYIPLRAASRKLFGKWRVSMGKEANDIISGAYWVRVYQEEKKIRDLSVDLVLD